MAEESPYDSDENESERWRPTVPTVVIAVAVVIALVAVSALLVVLFRRTTGPGEVLRDFSRAVAAEDCAGSYGLLDQRLRRQIPEEDWCERLPGIAGTVPPDFDIERVTLEQGQAGIRIDTGEREIVWVLVREERSWQILGTRDPAVLPVPGGEPTALGRVSG